MQMLAETKHNEELEQYVLSILIFGGGNYAKFINFLEPNDFYKSRHKGMFEVVQRMQAKDIAIDPVNFTLETQAEYSNEIADLGPMYVSDVKLEGYAENLKKLAIERKKESAFEIKDYNESLKLIKTDPTINKRTFFELEELNHKAKNYFKKGQDPCVSTGWHSIDDYYKIGVGQLTVVTGMPNSGKSNWLDALAVNLAKDNDYKFVFFSPENLPIHRHLRSLIEKFSHIAYFKQDNDSLEVSLDWIHEHFRFIDPMAINRNIDSIIDIIEGIGSKVDGVIIDPWNEIEHLRPNYMTETEYTGSVLTKIRSMAINLNLHCWIVAHPTKLKKEKGKYPPPSPYDISGSANWRNKPDNCITVYRDFQTDDVCIHIQKIRFKDFGKLGSAGLVYDKNTGEYKELSKFEEKFPGF